MRIKDRIYEIVARREELLNELKSLQESCSHEEYHIGTYSWRVGAYDHKRICLECGCILETPSEDELKEFIEEIEAPYIELNKKRKEECEKNNWVYVKSFPIGQGTKIYKREIV